MKCAESYPLYLVLFSSKAWWTETQISLLLKNCHKKWSSGLHLNKSLFPFLQKTYRHSVINWMFWSVLSLWLYWNGFTMMSIYRNYSGKVWINSESDYEMHLKETNFCMCENNFNIAVNFRIYFSADLKLILRK